MKINLEELPIEQFALLGMNKKDVINLPPRTLNALLNGGRTSLMRFGNIRINGMDIPTSLDAKLSLARDKQGNVKLRIHPINQSPRNIYGLSPDEITYLQKNDTNLIDKKVSVKPGGVATDILVSYDRTLNEFVALNKSAVNAPESINGISLSDQQKEDFKNGKEIKLNGEGFRLNPNSEIGVSGVEKRGHVSEITKMKFRHSSYSSNELLLDLALVSSGLGGTVMLEHLANIAFHSRETQQPHTKNTPQYWDALEKAEKEIVAVKGEHNYSRGEFGDIVSKYLSEFGVNTGVSVGDVDNALIGTGNKLNDEDIPSKQQKNSSRKMKM